MSDAKRLRHQRAARRDLAELWAFTARLWHEAQADAYLTELDEVLQQIATGRARGTRYDDRYQKYRFKAHVIFYRDTECEIVVVRVLHGRRDFARHLPA